MILGLIVSGAVAYYVYRRLEATNLALSYSPDRRDGWCNVILEP